MQRILILLILFSLNLAHAQTVEKVKGTKALLDMGEELYSVGTELVSVTVDGRKVGLLKVTQIKGSKAVAEIKKGIAAAGMTLQPKPAPKKRFAEEPGSNELKERKATQRTNALGALFAYSLDSMSVTSTSTVTYSGNSMKLKGFYDYILNDNWSARLASGLDGFNASASSGNLAIQYLGFDGAVCWDFYQNKKSRAFFDVGFSYQIPMSSSNTIGVSASNSSVLFFGGGMNVPIGNEYFLPFFMHYNYIFPSTGISLYSIDFGIGFGWN